MYSVVNIPTYLPVEVHSDFPNNRLPTLDFFLWPEWWGINHSFFEKEMRTPFLTMQRSAICDHQRYSILANDLVRRLSNVNIERVPQEEVIQIIEKFIQLLVNSGYDRAQAREAVVSGIRGWRAKMKRRQDEPAGFYRNAASTMAGRYKKKLTAKTSWYKQQAKNRKRKHEMDEEELAEEEERMENKRSKKPNERLEGEEDNKSRGENLGKNLDKNTSSSSNMNKAKAVLFVPYTVGGTLAKRLRQAEENLMVTTGYKIKIVERGGTKLEDLLHKSDPCTVIDRTVSCVPQSSTQARINPKNAPRETLCTKLSA